MSIISDRQKEFLKENTSSTSQERQKSILQEKPATESPNFETVKQNFLTLRRSFLDAPKEKTKTPLFEEMESSQKARLFPESVKPVTFGILNRPDRDIVSKFMGMPTEKKAEATRDMLSTILIGKTEKSPIGKEQTIAEGGALGFFYGNLLKTEKQRQGERYEKLVAQGINPDRAFKIATAWSAGRPLPTDISPEESSAMRWETIKDNTFVALELADFMFIGKPINSALKVLKRGEQLALFTDIAAATNAKLAREIVIAKYPQLAGTEGIDELIALARKVGEKDNWSKVLADTKTGKELLSGKVGGEKIIPTTEAQKIVYKDGIPVLQATPTSGVDELVTFRDQIRNVLRGGKEEARLSNANVLADEIKAGSLPFKQASDGTVEVFATRNIARLRNGEPVSLSEELAKNYMGGARKFTAKVDDLVRLEDGTFAYAPKKFINESAEPSIKAIRSEKQEAVKLAEKTIADEAVELAKAEERAAGEESRAAIRKTKKDAEAKSLQEAEIARVGKEAEENAIKYKAQTRANTKERLAELKSRFDAPNNIISKVTKDIPKLIDSIKKADPEMKVRLEKKLEEARETLTKANNEKMSLVEYETKKERIRVEAKKEIAKVNDDVKKASVKTTKTEVKPENIEPTTADTIAETYKKSADTVKTSAKASNFNPIKSEGEKVASKFSENIAKEVADIAKREGVELQDLPLEHRVASNQTQMEKAFAEVSQNPEEAYQKFINNEFTDETTNAAIFNALTKGDFFKGDRLRVDNMLRTFYKQGTRAGQELQARKMIGALDYSSLVAKLMRRGDSVLASKGIKMDTETRKIVDALGDSFDLLKGASKKEVIEIITEKTCKIGV